MNPKYLEDLHAGEVFTSAARTITESDVTAFAGLSGDFNPIHTDVEFARGTPYGQRVVYGLLGLAMLTGLLDRTGLFSGSAIPMLCIPDWTFTPPMFIGDTIRFPPTITDLPPPSSGHPGRAARHFELLNQPPY